MLVTKTGRGIEVLLLFIKGVINENCFKILYKYGRPLGT